MKNDIITQQNRNSIWSIQVEKIMYVFLSFLMSLLQICFTCTKTSLQLFD